MDLEAARSMLEYTADAARRLDAGSGRMETGRLYG
jgi:hypothetical protein